MKTSSIPIKALITLGAIFTLFLMACYWFDFVNQPHSADPNSTFEVQISVTTNVLDDWYTTGNYIPYFGVLLPQGWKIKDGIDFTGSNDTYGTFVYSSMLSREMDSIDPAPVGYYWWVSAGKDSVPFNYEVITYHFNPEITTDAKKGTFRLDYMLGPGDNTKLNYTRSNNHAITVGLSEDCTVTSVGDSGPGTLRAAIDSVDYYGRISFALEDTATIILEEKLMIEKAIQINGPELNPVTISGNNHTRIFHINNAPGMSLSNLNMIDGYGENGGAILCENSKVTINNVTVSNSTATGNGGGMYFAGSHPTLQNISITGNSADNSGGGLYFGDSHAVLHNVILSDNTSTDGGGMFIGGGSSILEQISLSKNSASHNGGGLYMDGTATIKDSRFMDNSASFGGGGIYTSGSTTLQNVLILHNMALELGGGLYCADVSPKFNPLARSSIYLNQAPLGGDIYSNPLTEVIVDTFTVMYPRWVHAYPIKNFRFYILHGLLPQDHTDLYVSPDGDDNNSGLSPNDPLKTINKALHLNSDLCTIHLANGIYSPSGTEEVFPLFLPTFTSIKGATKEHTILDAEGLARVMDICSHGISISGMTISGGLTTSEPGGGIIIVNADASMEEIIMTNNSSGDNGGGIYSQNSNLDLQDIVFKNNFSARCGGGFHCSESTVAIQNAVFEYNHAVNQDGGIGYDQHSTSSLQTSAPTNDYPYCRGGGIYCANSILSMDNSIIISNIASNKGGGVYVSCSDVVLTKSKISGNSSDDGGGLFCLRSSVLAESTFISENAALEGGGIYSDHSRISLINVPMLENYSEIFGGGLFGYYAHVCIVNTTMAGNHAQYGSGIYGFRSDIRLSNTILWNDGPDQVYFYQFFRPSTIEAAFSAVKGGVDGIMANDNGIVTWLAGNIQEDPLFVGMGDHPYALSDSSPCIDAGTPDTTGMNLPPWDILGNPRIRDGDGDGVDIVDMGAYESGSVRLGREGLAVGNWQWAMGVYPNPASAVSTIKYYSAGSGKQEAGGGKLKITLHDIRGRLIRDLVDEVQMPGEYTVYIDVSGLPVGIYFIRLQAGDAVETAKMVVVR